MKEGSSDGDNGVMKGPRGSQSIPEVTENGGGKDGFPKKTFMESGEGASGLVGVEFADHRDWVEIHRLGEVDIGSRVSGAVDLGVHNSSIEVGIDLALTFHKEHVYCIEDEVGLDSKKEEYLD